MDEQKVSRVGEKEKNRDREKKKKIIAKCFFIELLSRGVKSAIETNVP